MGSNNTIQIFSNLRNNIKARNKNLISQLEKELTFEKKKKEKVGSSTLVAGLDSRLIFMNFGYVENWSIALS